MVQRTEHWLLLRLGAALTGVRVPRWQRLLRLVQNRILQNSLKRIQAANEGQRPRVANLHVDVVVVNHTGAEAVRHDDLHDIAFLGELGLQASISLLLVLDEVPIRLDDGCLEDRGNKLRRCRFHLLHLVILGGQLHHLVQNL